MTDGDTIGYVSRSLKRWTRSGCKLNIASSYIKLESQRPLTKRSKSLPKERFGFSCQATYDHDTKLKANSNPNVKDLL